MIRPVVRLPEDGRGHTGQRDDLPQQQIPDILVVLIIVAEIVIKLTGENAADSLIISSKFLFNAYATQLH